MTNEAAILGLLAGLYRDRAALQAEVARLRKIIEDARARERP